ncbi:DUF4184 family protein [Actinomadura logoneensis]|uniref:DUF4184 family protein n=1 Tax=Actinomadura logoneensis TaxID=2293572 RepID=A0A372JLI1_9ACTN|nr:DUF4184 family protein [Actinomadura logoneensis]RFU40178.1 DUF4184 family protein [Actinomadura logoneensis]
MPFTFCHPAVVLPLLRRPFVPVALVAGTMAPDLPYYVPFEAQEVLLYPGAWYFRAFDAGATHGVSGMFGMFGFDLLVTAVFVGVFQVCRKPLSLLLPARFASWSSVPASAGGRGVSLLLRGPVSALVGIGSHIAWDATTKGGMAAAFPSLRQPVVGSTDGLTVISYANTLIGAVVVIWWLWRRVPAEHSTASRPLPAPVRWGVPIGVLGAAGAAVAVPGPGTDSLRVMVVRAVGVMAAVLFGYAVTWHASRLLLRRGQTDASDGGAARTVITPAGRL